MIVKVNWQDEGLDTYYKKMGYPKSVWQDNEGKPFGIQSEYENEWFATEQERDQAFTAYAIECINFFHF